jgi:hypothetical protein
LNHQKIYFALNPYYLKKVKAFFSFLHTSGNHSQGDLHPHKQDEYGYDADDK